MKTNTIIGALFDWFADCELLDPQNKLNVENLGADAEQYSIEVVPCNPIVKKYVDGSCKYQYIFIFASRELYGEDEQLNISNLEFYEELEKWISEQNLNEHFPILPDDCTVQSVNVLSSGYIADNDAKTARYQIQCKLYYIKDTEVNYHEES